MKPDTATDHGLLTTDQLSVGALSNSPGLLDESGTGASGTEVVVDAGCGSVGTLLAMASGDFVGRRLATFFAAGLRAVVFLAAFLVVLAVRLRETDFAAFLALFFVLVFFATDRRTAGFAAFFVVFLAAFFAPFLALFRAPVPFLLLVLAAIFCSPF